MQNMATSPIEKEGLQGPFNWQKELRPTGLNRSKSSDLDNSFEEPVSMDYEGQDEERQESHRDEKGAMHTSRQRIDDENASHIREKLKQLAANKENKKGGPMHAKIPRRSNLPCTPKIPPGICPRYQKTKHISPQGSESAFTKHIVKSSSFNRGSVPHVVRKNRVGLSATPQPVSTTKIPLPTFTEKKSGLQKKNSTTGLIDGGVGHEVIRKRVEKVKRARLYLLQQMGPNSFLIGGDSPDHKFRVTIGPQQCSCGKGPQCLHVLFVMLRVFQVKETDPKLWNKLKNYEVDALFNDYRARRTSKLNEFRRRPNKLKNKEEPLSEEQVKATSSKEEAAIEETAAGNDSSDDERKDEENDCPICLLDMVEGESLVQCGNGCGNRLHHHCIDVWFEECRRTGEVLKCPLCREHWNRNSEECELTSLESQVDPSAPPNTRAPSPLSTQQDITLPRVDPIPEEQLEIARPWIPLLGEDLVSCMFSKQWVDREKSLKQLTRTASRALLLGVGQGRTGAVISESTQETTRNMLECCFSVLAYMLADPVYCVFVAGLKVLRNVLAVTPCRDESQKSRLQHLIKPVVHTILWKCADSNKRTSLLSISALQEFVKGQEGELAVGREIVNPGSFVVGGVDYILNCILEDYSEEETTQYQWLLGRFYMLDNLIAEYPTEFTAASDQPQPDVNQRNPDNEGNNTEEITSQNKAAQNIPQALLQKTTNTRNQQRVTSVLQFAKSCFGHVHKKVERMARRIFYHVAKLHIKSGLFYRDILNMLDDVDMTIQDHMRRRLNRHEDEYTSHSSERTGPGTGAHGSDRNSDTSLGGRAGYEITIGVQQLIPEAAPLHTTPVISGESTPRSFSPSSDMEQSELENVNLNVPTHRLNLIAPPNSPQKFKPKLQRQRPVIKSRDSSSSDDRGDISSSLHLDGRDRYHLEAISSNDDSECESKRNTPVKQSAAAQQKKGEPFADLVDGRVVMRSPPKTSRLVFEDVESPPFGKSPGTVRRNRRKCSVDVADVNAAMTSHSKGSNINNDLAVGDIKISIAGDHLGESSTDPIDEVKEIVLPQGFLIKNFTLEHQSTQCPEVQDVPYDHHPLSFPKDPSYEHEENSKFQSKEVQTSSTSTERSLSHGESDDSLHSYTLNHDSLEEQNEEEIDVPVTLVSVTRSLRRSLSSPAKSENLKSEKTDIVAEPNTNENSSDQLLSQQGSSQLQDSPDRSLKSVGRGSSFTDDYSDYLMSPESNDQEKVTFKTEVTQSPSHTPTQHASPPLTAEDCHCKEEVEEEEAKALVQAIEQSNVGQNALPYVPGLSSNDANTVTIHTEPTQGDGLGESPVHQYLEGKEWVRGPMLGTGAFSTCYQARDVESGTLMCVKQISFCRNAMDEQQKVCEAVRAEIEMMGKLNHPHVVRILGATQQASHFFMFVEWMPGGSISYLLDLYGAFTEKVLVDYMRQILLGLAYLHDNQILHRDLKGANLLVDSTGQRLRIGDFGAAARLMSRHTLKGEFQGQLLGTIAFMAPETLRGENYGRSCDIWSVGCVVIEMLTCKPPWGESNLSNHLAMIFKIASTTEPPTIPPYCHQAIRDMTLRCLELNRDERPPAKELLKHPVFQMFAKKRR